MYGAHLSGSVLEHTRRLMRGPIVRRSTHFVECSPASDAPVASDPFPTLATLSLEFGEVLPWVTRLALHVSR